MFNWLARILLTSTAIAPVGFTYAWVALSEGEYRTSLIIACLSVAAFILCLLMLRFAKRNLEKIPFKPKTIEAADRENIGFMLLYLLPLFTSKVSSMNWNLWIPTLGIFALITANGYGYHFNPLLGLMRWHFYKVASEEGVTYVLITKRHLRNASAELIVGQLTEYILIDIGD
jgi:hypothetical protein